MLCRWREGPPDSAMHACTVPLLKQLAELMAQVMSQRLDRDHPLSECRLEDLGGAAIHDAG